VLPLFFALVKNQNLSAEKEEKWQMQQKSKTIDFDWEDRKERDGDGGVPEALLEQRRGLGKEG
jgi:hypothetical protein